MSESVQIRSVGKKPPKMNARARSLSPNTLRRLLVAHGRTTTPGVFDASIIYRSDKKKVEDVPEKQEIVEKEPLPKKSADNVSEVVQKASTNSNVLLNPPLLKPKALHQMDSSQSFYTRPFKVHGKEAWEFAMRGLGSVDTLMNRYGYVDPIWRGKIHPSPTEYNSKNAPSIKKLQDEEVKSVKENTIF